MLPMLKTGQMITLPLETWAPSDFKGGQENLLPKNNMILGRGKYVPY